MRGTHARAREECEEEGVAETKGYELTTTLIPSYPPKPGGRGRELRGEAEPWKKAEMGGRWGIFLAMFLFLFMLL